MNCNIAGLTPKPFLVLEGHDALRKEIRDTEAHPSVYKVKEGK